jgi:hypothetical protein
MHLAAPGEQELASMELSEVASVAPSLVVSAGASNPASSRRVASPPSP